MMSMGGRGGIYRCFAPSYSGHIFPWASSDEFYRISLRCVYSAS